MMEWPARCSECHEPIDDWADAGLFRGRWIHKTCFSDHYAAAPEGLRSPVERSAQLELPMLIFLLLFHFGLGAAVAGWVMLTQLSESIDGGLIVLGFGLVLPLIGAAGAAVNIVSRRRIEVIRQELETQGGWKAGR